MHICRLFFEWMPLLLLHYIYFIDQFNPCASRSLELTRIINDMARWVCIYWILICVCMPSIVFCLFHFIYASFFIQTSSFPLSLFQSHAHCTQHIVHARIHATVLAFYTEQSKQDTVITYTESTTGLKWQSHLCTVQGAHANPSNIDTRTF